MADDPRSPTTPAGFTIVVQADDYEVVGSTLAQLRAMAALLGPLRSGRRHAAYTAWELRWSYARRETPDGWRAAAVRVEARVTRTLPRWTPVRSADPSLPDAWARYLDALTLHEQGHVAIADEAGRAVHAALSDLPCCATRERLDALARSAARAVSSRYREEERAYDALTGHGATQGCE
jgi:predicted secreted Zn-dependent protease